MKQREPISAVDFKMEDIIPATATPYQSPKEIKKIIDYVFGDQK